jgi:uncharacterized OsmC-like protein
MMFPQKIKTAFERSAKAISLRPAIGRGTGISKTTVRNGLTCEIEEGGWHFKADMPEQAGGSGEGPTPGVYGRAALGSCLAMGYMMRAAYFNVPIDSLQVEVHADYDDGALFGVNNVFPGYQQVRYVVIVESDAPEKDIRRVIDEADRHSPYLDVFSRAQDCRREIKLVTANNK